MTILAGKKAKADYYDPATWEVFLVKGQAIDEKAIDRLELLNLFQVEIDQHGGVIDHVPVDRWVGFGRYKTATARMMLKAGNGELRVNGNDVWEYFIHTPKEGADFLRRLMEMEDVQSILGRMEGIVHVHGSSPEHNRQAKAVAHSLAHALYCYDEGLKEKFRKAGYKGKKIEKDDEFREWLEEMGVC